MNERYDVKAVFDRYTTVENLKEADIFHLYDSGIECKPEELGYHDARLFTGIAFNTTTMERMYFRKHDGLHFHISVKVRMIRIFADGSTMVKLYEPASIDFGQVIMIGYAV